MADTNPPRIVLRNRGKNNSNSTNSAFANQPPPPAAANLQNNLNNFNSSDSTRKGLSLDERKKVKQQLLDAEKKMRRIDKKNGLSSPVYPADSPVYPSEKKNMVEKKNIYLNKNPTNPLDMVPEKVTTQKQVTTETTRVPAKVRVELGNDGQSCIVLDIASSRESNAKDFRNINNNINDFSNENHTKTVKPPSPNPPIRDLESMSLSDSEGLSSSLRGSRDRNGMKKTYRISNDNICDSGASVNSSNRSSMHSNESKDSGGDGYASKKNSDGDSVLSKNSNASSNTQREGPTFDPYTNEKKDSRTYARFNSSIQLFDATVETTTTTTTTNRIVLSQASSSADWVDSSHDSNWSESSTSTNLGSSKDFHDFMREMRRSSNANKSSPANKDWKRNSTKRKSSHALDDLLNDENAIAEALDEDEAEREHISHITTSTNKRNSTEPQNNIANIKPAPANLLTNVFFNKFVGKANRGQGWWNEDISDSSDGESSLAVSSAATSRMGSVCNSLNNSLNNSAVHSKAGSNRSSLSSSGASSQINSDFSNPHSKSTNSKVTSAKSSPVDSNQSFPRIVEEVSSKCDVEDVTEVLESDNTINNFINSKNAADSSGNCLLPSPSPTDTDLSTSNRSTASQKLKRAEEGVSPTMAREKKRLLELEHERREKLKKDIFLKKQEENLSASGIICEQPPAPISKEQRTEEKIARLTQKIVGQTSGNIFDRTKSEPSDLCHKSGSTNKNSTADKQSSKSINKRRSAPDSVDTEELDELLSNIVDKDTLEKTKSDLSRINQIQNQAAANKDSCLNEADISSLKARVIAKNLKSDPNLMKSAPSPVEENRRLKIGVFLRVVFNYVVYKHPFKLFMVLPLVILFTTGILAHLEYLPAEQTVFFRETTNMWAIAATQVSGIEFNKPDVFTPKWCYRNSNRIIQNFGFFFVLYLDSLFFYYGIKSWTRPSKEGWMAHWYHTAAYWGPAMILSCLWLYIKWLDRMVFAGEGMM